MTQKIDIDTWERKQQFIFFKQFSDPYAAASTVINVDRIVRYAKENAVSFYGTMSYVVLDTINQLEEYKYVLDGENVYKYDQINMTFAVLRKDNKLNFSRVVYYNEYETFMNEFMYAKKEAEENAKVPYVEGNNKIYITCLPWMRFTSIDNPKNCNKIDSIPRICWGKYFLENGEYKIDISLQVNHAFQDGYHIGLFFNTLQNNISKFMEKKHEKTYSLHRLG